MKGYKMKYSNLHETNPCIYVANLGAYNAGRMVGWWLDLTTFKDKDELQEAVDKVANYLGSIYGDEWAIHDTSNFPDMGENPDLEKVIEVAAMIKQEGYEQVKAFLEVYSIEDLEHFEDSYQGHWDSFKEFATEYMDNCMEVPEHLEDYIDYEKFSNNLSYDYSEVDASTGGVFVFGEF